LPLTIPPFNQYQSPIVPLRGLWNAAPAEGDKFITAEIDWFVTTTQPAVQFAVSANSPVAFSQIVALAVDNSRSGADVVFVFSDSGFELVVPAHNQGVFPVFTNGLMFYVVSANAQAGDVTAFQVLNSMPPPVPIAPSSTQNHAGQAGIGPGNGSTVIVPAGVNGTLNVISISFDVTVGATAESGAISLIDGSGKTLWTNLFAVGANATNNFDPMINGLAVRFVNGINCVVSASSFTSGFIIVNVYYSQP
jgi:hypothetical protein